MSSLKIGTNIAAISADRHLSRAAKQTEHALRALSSGQRIVSAGDDAAGFAIGENLRAQLSGVKRSQANASDAASFIQVAEGALNEQDNILIRLRELGVQAASDTVGDTEREYLNQEFTQLRDEFERIAQTTRFGDQNLLNGQDKTLTFQVGSENQRSSQIRYNLNADTTARQMGISSLEIADRDDAQDALEDIDSALREMGSIRASFGAIQSRLEVAQNHAAIQFENLSLAHSRIMDADVAEEAAQLAQGQILQSLAISVLAQANQDANRVLKLL